MDAPIGAVSAWAYTVLTDAPEADGTFAWTDTTPVVVTVQSGGATGLGSTYGAASLVTGKLAATARPFPGTALSSPP